MSADDPWPVHVAALRRVRLLGRGGDTAMNIYVIESDAGLRIWQAESADHAIKQHMDAFPDESVRGISIAVRAQWGDNALPAARAAH